MPFPFLLPLTHAVAWLVAGFVVCTTGLNPFFSILFFELPLLLQFKKKGYFESGTPLKVYLVCLALFALISGLGIWLGAMYAQANWPYFTLAIGLCVLANAFSLKYDPTHKNDFIEDNTAYLSTRGYQELIRHREPHSQAPEKSPQPEAMPAYSGIMSLLKRCLRIRIKIGQWEIGIE